ncbi:MAG: hypothetical protein JWM80_4972 [Cyanobacteria bacterium RYN_339]|nr:hypothetical protein [Cyanobacteria bacterium RYN_339]
MVLVSLFLAAAFTRLWEPAGGVELNYSPATVGHVRTKSWGSLNEDKPAYSVLGDLDDAWAEGIAHAPPIPAPADLTRLDRCSFHGLHFATANRGGEAHAWVWSKAGVHWEARGPAKHYVDLVEWAYSGAFRSRCDERGDPTGRLPKSFFRQP